MADDRDAAIQHFSVRPASQCLPIIVAASEVLRWVRRIRKSGRQSFLAGFEFGRAVERMFLSAAEPEFAGMGLATKQTFVRNQQNNRKRSAEAEVRRQSRKKLVEKEIARQKKVGERMNYQKGLEFAAKAEGCSVEIVKKSVPNQWTNRTAQ